MQTWRNWQIQGAVLIQQKFYLLTFHHNLKQKEHLQSIHPSIFVSIWSGIQRPKTIDAIATMETVINPNNKYKFSKKNSMIIMQHFILCWSHTQIFHVIMTHRNFANLGLLFRFLFLQAQVNVHFFFACITINCYWWYSIR